MLRNQENQITYPNPTPSSFYYFPSTRWHSHWMQFSINIFCAGGVTFKTVVKTGAKRNGGTDAKVWERGMRHLIVLQFKCTRITHFEIIRPVYLRFDTLTFFIRWLILYHCTSTCSTISAQITIKMMSQAKHMMQCI